MNKKTQINNIIKYIKHGRMTLIKENPTFVWNNPQISLDRVAEMIYEQQKFVDRELLTQHLFNLYAINTFMFFCIVSKSVLDAIKFDEEYVDECISELSSLVDDGKVYKQYNGIFMLWTCEENKDVLTIEDAVGHCDVSSLP
jgi:hypothetical protein